MEPKDIALTINFLFKLSVMIGIVFVLFATGIRLLKAQSVQMSASVELTGANAFSTCVQERCGHLK